MALTNNDIFKKLRVAHKLTNDDIIKIMAIADFKISKSELGAIFRHEDHPKYVECGDQYLRKFLDGLIIHKRGPMPKKKGEKKSGGKKHGERKSGGKQSERKKKEFSKKKKRRRINRNK